MPVHQLFRHIWDYQMSALQAHRYPKWSELALFLNPLIEQIEAFDTELCYHERHQNLTQDV